MFSGFANYEFRLPNSFHGTDNGALHAYLAEVLFPQRTAERSICEEIYNKSDGYDALFAFEACIRSIFGAGTDFGKIRIMNKGTGWARDTWLTNSKWSPERDFMIHEWKMDQQQNYTILPIPINNEHRNTWHNPFNGSFDISKCGPENSTWYYDTNLISSKIDLEIHLATLYKRIERDKLNSLAKASEIMRNNQNKTN